MRDPIKTRLAIMHYLKNKLPEGWRTHDMNCHPYYDNFLGIIRTRCPDGLARVFYVKIDDDPESAAQKALHGAYGWEEIGLV